MATTTIRHGQATMKLYGFDELFAKLLKISDKAQAVGVQVLNNAVAHVYDQSQQLVPVAVEDGGQLRASGRKNNARVSKRSGRVTASVTYGGARLAALTKDNPLYALAQHEDLSMKHTHGQAKFLELPYLAEKEPLMAALGQKIIESVSK